MDETLFLLHLFIDYSFEQAIASIPATCTRLSISSYSIDVPAHIFAQIFRHLPDQIEILDFAYYDMADLTIVSSNPCSIKTIWLSKNITFLSEAERDCFAKILPGSLDVKVTDYDGNLCTSPKIIHMTQKIIDKVIDKFRTLENLGLPSGVISHIASYMMNKENFLSDHIHNPYNGRFFQTLDRPEPAIKLNIPDTYKIISVTSLMSTITIALFLRNQLLQYNNQDWHEKLACEFVDIPKRPF